MHRVTMVPGGDDDAYNDDGDPPPPPRTVSTAPALMPEMIGENQGVAAEERVRLYLPRAVVGGAEMYVSQHLFARSFPAPRAVLSLMPLVRPRVPFPWVSFTA